MSRPTSFLVDGTVYWTINTYDEDGVLVDADNNPIVDIRRNGQLLPLDVANVSKRGGVAGTYDCSYNPATDSEGDCYQFEETANVSSQAYKNTWNCEVMAPQRGTDGANTVTPNTVTPNTVAPDNASIASILADTNELQSNQGDWATATSVVASNMRGTDNASTFDHTSDAVVTDTASRNASKADVSGLSTFDPSSDEVVTDAASRAASKADVSGLSTFDSSTDQVVASNMRGTDDALLASDAPNNFDIMVVDGSGKVTTSNPASGGGSAHTAQDVAALILAVPNTPINNTASGSIALVDTTTNLTNQGGGSGGDDAATIYSYFTAGSREDAFKADVSNLATSSQVNGIDVPSESDVYNYFTSGSREDQFKANVSGLSTLGSVDVTNAVTTSLNSYDAAKGSEITSARNEIVSDIAGLNNFDPAYDTVVNVDTVQNVVNGGSGGGGGGDATAANQTVILSAINDLNDFDPNSDVVQNVNTVQTVINGGGSGGGGGGTITVKATPTPRAF